jgi:hypothetical protein
MNVAQSSPTPIERVRAALRAREAALHGRDVLGHALAYAARGLLVFPCASRSKNPAGWLARHGVSDATTDELTIRRWFRDETLNIAIAGSDAAVFLDVDVVGPAHPKLTRGGDEELAALEATHGVLPETPRALTPGGGTHYFFRAPPGVRLRNGAIDGCDAVEVKAHGGYVLAEPSIHPLGGMYRNDVGAHLEDVTIAPMPAWLVTLATGKTRGAVAPSSGIDARISLLGQIFERCGALGDALPDGRRIVRCPWSRLHSDGRGDGRDTSTVLFPRSEGKTLGGFHCSHSHCSHRTGLDILDATPAGIRNKAESAMASLLRGTT